MKDISFDLETLGIGPEAMILSIGAVKFDRVTSELGEEFSRVIDIASPLGGGTIDASTVVWWMDKPQQVRDAVFGKDVERVPLRQALAEFSEFIGFTDELPDGEYPDVTLWQRGDKDSQWLESAYAGMQLQLPFRYWQVSDQRTLCNQFKPFLPDQDEGHWHCALYDARYQAHCLIAAFGRMYSTGAILPPPIGLTPPTKVG